MQPLLKLYSHIISPAIHLIGGAGMGCRFEPTCSEYGYQAIKSHGFLKGIWLSIKRVLRCHPFSQGGRDLVP